MNWILAFLVVGITIAAITPGFLFMRSQRRRCAKYPFYAHRDRVLLAMTECPEEAGQYERVYESVNSVVHHVHRFNFSFFAEFLTKVSEGAIERAYQEAVSGRQDRLDLDLNELEAEYMRLIVESAKANSLPIRLSTTRLGMSLVFPPTFAAGLVRFLRKHPEVFAPVAPPLATLQKYALLAHSV